MPRKKTRSFRLPKAVGHYRKGVFFKGGSIVTLPGDEKPGMHWKEVRLNRPRPVVEDMLHDAPGAGDDDEPEVVDEPATMSEAQTRRRRKPEGA